MNHRTAAGAYQREFDEMFERGEFGTRSSDDGIVSYRQGESEVSIIFAAESDEIGALKAEIQRAARSIRIMTFVFSLERTGRVDSASSEPSRICRARRIREAQQHGQLESASRAALRRR